MKALCVHSRSSTFPKLKVPADNLPQIRLGRKYSHHVVLSCLWYSAIEYITKQAHHPRFLLYSSIDRSAVNMGTVVATTPVGVFAGYGVGSFAGQYASRGFLEGVELEDEMTMRHAINQAGGAGGAACGGVAGLMTGLLMDCHGS